MSKKHLLIENKEDKWTLSQPLSNYSDWKKEFVHNHPRFLKMTRTCSRDQLEEQLLRLMCLFSNVVTKTFKPRMLDLEKIINDLAPIKEKQSKNLAAGRPKGVEKRKQMATEKQAQLTKAIADLFDTPEKPGWGWSNDEIATYLKTHRTFLYSKYAYSSILKTVKREAAKFREARKERQASQSQNR